MYDFNFKFDHNFFENSCIFLPHYVLILIKIILMTQFVTHLKEESYDCFYKHLLFL